MVFLKSEMRTLASQSGGGEKNCHLKMKGSVFFLFKISVTHCRIYVFKQELFEGLKV
jgi:hypothetical protein